MKLEPQAQLLIVDPFIASKIEQGVVEVCQCLFKVAEEEVGNALLEICYSEIRVKLNGSLVTLDLQTPSVMLLLWET